MEVSTASFPPSSDQRLRPLPTGRRLVDRAQREAELQEWLPAATDALVRTLEWSAELGREDATTCILACGPRSVKGIERAVSMFVHVQDAGNSVATNADTCHADEKFGGGTKIVVGAPRLTCYARHEDGCFVWYEPSDADRAAV